VRAAHEEALNKTAHGPLAEKISVSYAADTRPLLPLEKKAVAPEATIIPAVTASLRAEKVTAGLLRRTAWMDQLAYPVSARNVVARRAVNGLIFAVLFVAIVVNYFLLANHTSKLVTARSAGANVYDAALTVFNFARANYEQIAELFGHGRALSVNSDAGTEQVPVFPTGLAVEPSTGNAGADAVEKQKLADTFSDQVSVNPDKSGTAGVITPVFKQGNGSNFMYVLVPVKENKNNATTK
jgi:hypothetical protein